MELDRIITSPLPRARRTAQIVAQELGLTDRLVTSSVLTAGPTPRPSGTGCANVTRTA